MFELIYEPLCIPLTIEEGYKKQNILLNKTRFLYTAFEGIKLNHFLDIEPPVLMKGSICLFCNSIYESKKDISLVDNSQEEGNRYIRLKLSNNGKNLIAELVTNLDCFYNEELGGFYKEVNGELYKYVSYYMYYDGNRYKGYYLDNYNNEVY
ncbi:hypothetical protein [Brachyspira pulli]|uniref:hypothetical protein n=1 Tax=Brachyspira pulli TaxID=310721 RepID=UPI003006AD0B